VEEEEVAEDEEQEPDEDDLDGLYHPPPAAEGDLQRVSAAELARKKAEMEKVFARNVLKPSDPGYVYDKQVEFEQPTEESEWD